MKMRIQPLLLRICVSILIITTTLNSQHTSPDPRTIPHDRLPISLIGQSITDVSEKLPSHEEWVIKLDAGARFAMYQYASGTGLGKETNLFYGTDIHFGVGAYDSGEFIVDVFIKLDNPSSVSILNKFGLDTLMQTGDIITARVPVDMLEDLAREPSVQSVAMSYKRPGLNHLSKVDIRSDLVHQGFELPQAYQGEGVIVGVIDSGIDFSHPDFSDENGTRIQYLLEFTKEGGQNEWTKAQIDANPAGVTQRDGDGGGGHGTHVTGSAAGGGRFSSSMKGVAPRSDIIFVKGVRDPESTGGFGDVDVVNGVQYIFQKAGMLGKPAVVNLSLGAPVGPLDGTSLFEQALSNLTGPGKIIVASCGNSGFDRIHAGGQTQADVVNVSMIIPDNPHISVSEMWYKQGAVSHIAIGAYIQDTQGEWYYNETPVVPVGQALGLDNQGNITPHPLVVNEQTVGYVVIDAITTQDPRNGDGNIASYIFNNNVQNVDISSALWAILTVGPVSERLDAWVIQGGEFYDQPMGFEGYTEMPGNTSHTIGSPSTALKVISVGSYVTNYEWIDIDGNQRAWRNPDPNREPGQTVFPEIGQRSFFSSIGPTRDGRIAPDISAPGEFIFSTMSSHLSEGAGYERPLVLQGGRYLGMFGTSMSSPHVTGLVALMLQIEPTLTYDQVIALLNETARTDLYTGAVPNNNFGAGKIDAYAVIKHMAGEGPGPGETIVLKYFNPEGNQYNYMLDSVAPIDSGFVFGTNRYADKSKAQLLTLPPGMSQAYLNKVKVWFGYKRTGLTTQQYAIEVFNGTAATGPSGNALYSQSYLLSGISADDNFQTNENATVYTITPPIAVGQSFFVSVNFGAYGAEDYGSAAIVSTSLEDVRVPEVWEQWSNNQWHNVSDAWFSPDGQPNTGTKGAHLWIEATMNATVSVADDTNERPALFSLTQNYPNPFNAQTTIRISLPEYGHVSLSVYDVLGREIVRLIDEEMAPGVYTIPFEGNEISSGIYFYRLTAGSTTLVKRMILLR